MDLDPSTTERAPTTCDKKAMLGNFSEEMGFPDPVLVHYGVNSIFQKSSECHNKEMENIFLFS